MSQVFILLLYVFWIAAEPAHAQPHEVDFDRIAVFFAGFMLIVAVPALAIRLKTRAAFANDVWRLHRSVNRLIVLCRLAIVGWFFYGLFFGSMWAEFIWQTLGPLATIPVTLPGMLIGPLPALLAWMGLWWAQFPADRLARESSLRPLLEGNLPAHEPPSLLAFMASGFRLQILATAVPLLLIAFVRDAANVTLRFTGAADPHAGATEAIVSITAAIVVLIIAPEPLRRVFRTTRLPQSALRARLDELCRAAGTRYREVLLWNTGYAMGNAAVMGILPQIRYVMLSDLLLETMTDREIEAVFAHELGHIVHRHTLWYVVFVATLLIVSAGFEVLVGTLAGDLQADSTAGQVVTYATGFVMAGGAILLFGMFSRRLERQADVYAARTLEAAHTPPIAGRTEVGEHGASALAAALYRAASINHIPVEARSFRHGSIARRVRYIQNLAAHPGDTHKFDRSMRAVYTLLLCTLVSGGIWLAWYIFQARAAM